MNIERPEGTTRVCGVAQGFLGLPLRDEVQTFQLTDGSTYEAACMVTRWRPTDEERLRILAGEDIFVRVEGSCPPPMMLGIGDPAQYKW